MSWAEYMFSTEKRDVETIRVYSTLRLKDRPAANTTNQHRLAIRDKSSPSAYLLFGSKAPKASRTYGNEGMQALANRVCFENSVTKNANAKAKLRMLTYAEAEMLGCKKRASASWIKMTRMSPGAFQPPCHGVLCCNVSEIVNETMLCDGGAAGTPTCNPKTCKWTYDCSNATIEDDDGRDNITITPRSVYGKASRAEGESDSVQLTESSDRLSVGSQVGIGVGVSAGAAVLLVVLLIFIVKNSKKTVENV